MSSSGRVQLRHKAMIRLWYQLMLRFNELLEASKPVFEAIVVRL